MLRSDLCDFRDAYIVVKGTITLDGESNTNKRNKSVHLKIILHLSTAFQRSMVY